MESRLSLEDDKILPWQRIHYVQIVLEISQHLDHFVEYLPFYAQPIEISKRIRQLRQKTKEQFRSLSNLTKTYSDSLHKEKVLTRIDNLKEYPVLDEDFLHDFSVNLVNSQKKLLNNLHQILVRKSK